MPTTDRNISTNMSVDTLDMCATIQRKTTNTNIVKKNTWHNLHVKVSLNPQSEKF